VATSLRVVIDTNVLAPGSFELLEASPFRRLCKARRIIPVYSHVFLEETFRAYGSEGKREQLVQRWIPLIVATVDRFCDDFLGIWYKELVQGQGGKTNIYMRRRDQERLISRLPNIPLDGSWRAWHSSKLARNVEDAKRAAQRVVSKEVRQEVTDWRKAVNYDPKPHGVASLARFFETELDHAGRAFLIAQVECRNPVAVADRWAKDKMQYPYFTTFVMNMLYIAHNAMTRPSAPIDLNAQADLNMMTHLLHADALVSNETGFLRQAFDDLWRPKGKILFSSQQFVAFLQRL